MSANVTLTAYALCISFLFCTLP